MTAVQIMTVEGIAFGGTHHDLLDLQPRELSPEMSAVTHVTDALFERDLHTFEVVTPYLLGEAVLTDPNELALEDRLKTKQVVIELAREGYMRPGMARYCLNLLGLTPPREQNALPLTF